MKHSAFEGHIDQYLSGELSSHQANRLAQWIELDEQIADTLVEQRTVDQLFRLVEVDADNPDGFVDRCVDAFEDQFQVRITCDRSDQARLTSGRKFASTIAAAAVICILVSGVWFSLQEQPPPKAGQHIAARSQRTESQEEPAKSAIKETIVRKQPEPLDPKVHSILTEEPETEVATKQQPRPDSDSTEEKHSPIVLQPAPVGEGQAIAFAPPEKRPPFGKLISSRKAIWSSDSPGELEQGKFHLVAGSARLKYANGVLIRIAGPAEFELVNDNEIKVHRGQWSFTTPRKCPDFKCRVGDIRFQNHHNAAWLLNVDSDCSWESLITKGSTDLVNSNRNETQVRLSNNDLQQVAVVPPAQGDGDQIDSDLPTTLIARGSRRFLGQCFDDENSISFDRPVHLHQFLGHVINEPEVGWNRFCKSATGFQSELGGLNADNDLAFLELLGRHLKEQFQQEIIPFSSDERSPSATQFRGSMNINGVERQFNSMEEFNRAREQFFSGSDLGPIGSMFDSATSPHSVPDFEIGDRKIEFSPPEVFRQSRRNMNR